MVETQETTETNQQTPETSQPQLNKPAELNQAEPSQTAPELTPNLCRGYKVDPATRLHLCQSCAYHKWRNESKPWLRKAKKQTNPN